MLEIEIKSLSAASGTPKARIILEDSVDDFVTALPVCEIETQGIVTYGSSIKKTWKRSEVWLRTGVPNAKLRCTVAALDGTSPSLQVHAAFHTQSPIPTAISLPLQWFVDPISGSDTHTGTSQAQAFATFAPVPTEFSGTALQRIAGVWTDVTGGSIRHTLAAPGFSLEHVHLSGKIVGRPQPCGEHFRADRQHDRFRPMDGLRGKHGSEISHAHGETSGRVLLMAYGIPRGGLRAVQCGANRMVRGSRKPRSGGAVLRRCPAQGIEGRALFQSCDRTYEVRSNSTVATNTAAYLAMIEAQLTELLTNYGAIEAIVTDSWGWSPEPAAPGAIPGGALGGYTHIPYATLHSFIKALQPACLVIENEHAHPSTHSDVELYEVPVNGLPAGGNTRLSEEWDTLYNDAWFYVGGAVNMSLATLRARVSPANRLLNSSVALNAGPALDGLINNNSITWIQEGYNLAVGKTVTASSVYTTWVPSRVTDDDFTGMWSSDVGDANPWVEIDLGSAQLIAYCLAFNRSDTGFSGYFRDLKFTVYDATHTLLYTSPAINAANALGGGAGDYVHGPIRVDHNLAAPVTGRYVRLSRTDDATGHVGLACTEFLVLPQAWNRHGV